MNMRDLSRDDDFLSHLLVEKLGTGDVPLVVHKMDPTRKLPKTKAEDLLDIVRRVSNFFIAHGSSRRGSPIRRSLTCRPAVNRWCLPRALNRHWSGRRSTSCFSALFNIPQTPRLHTHAVWPQAQRCQVLPQDIGVRSEANQRIRYVRAATTTLLARL